MKKQILNLGKALTKIEQKLLNGGTSEGDYSDVSITICALNGVCFRRGKYCREQHCLPDA